MYNISIDVNQLQLNSFDDKDWYLYILYCSQHGDSSLQSKHTTTIDVSWLKPALKDIK
jgi:hypothetical protein